jgi:hypothetical protein
MSKRVSLAFLPLLVTLCLTGAGCNSALLSYRQLGACDDFDPAELAVGPNKAYVFFRMDSLDNSASAASVMFDPFQLYEPGVGQLDQTLSTTWAMALQAPVAGAVTVPGNTTQSLNGIAVMVVSTSTTDGAVEANMTSYFLDGAPGSGILPDKESSSQTSWPYTESCTAIKLAQ